MTGFLNSDFPVSYMKPKIGFSTGAFYTWYPDVNEQISLIRKLKVKAIELSFINLEELNTNISEQNIKYLKSISYVSLHAPIFDSSREKITFGKDNGIVKKLSDLYRKINAKTVVFHPDTVKDWDLISNFGMEVSVENLPIEDNFNNNKLAGLFKIHPEFSLVLDTAHAFSYNPSTLQKYMRLYKNRICHVHFSDRRFSKSKGKQHDHEQFLFCRDRKKFEAIRTLSCPIIIEISVKDKKYDLANIHDEIDSVQDFLSR